MLDWMSLCVAEMNLFHAPDKFKSHAINLLIPRFIPSNTNRTLQF